ncbi:MAG: hypothetical protein INR62_02250 [Rhodospirillales bacterium]|nr:hypothetical protein [Acetobacter sp.]
MRTALAFAAKRLPGGKVRRRAQAFSLIEVVLSAGILAFAVVPVVGLLAMGLTSTKDSTTDLAVANIVRSLRADFQANTGPFFTAAPAAPQSHYFTADGYPTTATDATAKPFYQADVSWSVPTSSVTTSNSARVVSVSITYPYPAHAQSSAASFFVAQ